MPSPNRESTPSAEQRGRELTGAISGHTLTDGDREQQIREAAYRRAEQRGFEPGAEIDDWLAAERELDEARGDGGVG
jgi:hypothetical protein